MELLANFVKIRILTRCQVRIEQKSEHSITFEPSLSVTKKIYYEQEGQQLIIRAKSEFLADVMREGSIPIVKITCPQLDVIEIFEIAVVTCVSVINSERLSIVVMKGSVDIWINTIYLDCTILKGGSAKFRGKVLSAFLLAYHNSQIQCRTLQCMELFTDLHDTSNAEIFVWEFLEISLFHKSSLIYTGNPKVSLKYIDSGCSIQSSHSIAKI